MRGLAVEEAVVVVVVVAEVAAEVAVLHDPVARQAFQAPFVVPLLDIQARLVIIVATDLYLIRPQMHSPMAP
jgi:hypothetical protein